jgi:N-acetylglucosaminyldiphosphoundecaprenol N-acetyl-beta-D-mannosaminyltransferase
MPNYKRSLVFNIPIAEVTLKTINRLITSFISNKDKKTFFYVNAHCINVASFDDEYKSILQKADLVYSGGYGPVLASKILNSHLLERTPTPDFIDRVFSEAEVKKWSFYFIGSKKQSLEKAVNIIKNQFPTLHLKGYHHGYFSKDEEIDLIKDINNKKPTILIVGMGTPKQEKWIANNIKQVDAKIFWAVGAMFDVISGSLPRAPKWMQIVGCEWLYRLFQEPKRLWKRYTLGNLYFVYLIFRELIKKLLQNRLILIVIILEILVISGLIWHISYKKSAVLGTNLSVYPITKSDYDFSSTDRSKYFYEPKINSTRVYSVDWLPYQTEYHFNNEGFNNSTDFSITKPKDTFRIVALGDSHTFGLYVDPSKNFPTQLGKILSNLCKDSPNIEVLNLGVPGYDLNYSIERFSKRGQKYNPDLVVWLIKDDDILQINSLIKEKVDAIKKNMEETGEIKEYQNQGEYYPYQLMAQNALVEELGEDKLIEIQNQSMDYFTSLYSGDLLLFSYPSNSVSYMKFLKPLAKRRINTYLYEDFPLLDNNTDFLPDRHPNENGYAFIAKKLADFIQSRNILSCGNDK